MAKSSFWLNGAKGKFAGATIYNADGQSVMRVINKSIKNPRTTAQMVQRVISKTVMNQYAAMKAICDHSFQGKTAGAKCMAHFASINNKATRNMIAEMQAAGISFANIYNFIPCKAVKFVPATCIISEGTLPQIYATVENGVGAVAAAGNTYEDIINSFGLQRGDQLTFVTIEKNGAGDYKFNYARVILDPRNPDGTPAPLSSQFSNGDGVEFPSFRNEGNFEYLEFDASKLLFTVLGGEDVVAAGIIASRQVDNDWLRSTCQLDVDPTLLGDDKKSLEEAIVLSTASTPIYTNSPRYLNNAGVGGPQEGASPVPENFSVRLNNTGEYIPVTDGTLSVQSDVINKIKISGLSAGYTIEVYGMGQLVGTMGYDADEEVYTYYNDVSLPATFKVNGVTFLTITEE